MDFKQKISPFFWVEHESSYSVCLNVGEYKVAIFTARQDEGFEGGGYDWTSLARVFVAEKMPNLGGVIGFYPEGSMFCAYADEKEKLQAFILGFKAACENDNLINDLFSRAELD